MGLSTEDESALALRADRARQDLADTLATLGEREHGVVEELPVRGARRTAVLVAAGASVTGLVALGICRTATAPRRRSRERRLMLARVWTHPERTARKKSWTMGTVVGPALAALAGAAASLLFSGTASTRAASAPAR